MTTTAAIIATRKARAKLVATLPRTQLIRGVDMDDKMQLKITGKNSDGEYWLHLVGGGQNAGFNLGDPATMVGAALLKAASGQRFVSVPSPADPVRDALVEALEAMRDDPTIKAICNSQLWAKMVNALAQFKGEKE